MISSLVSCSLNPNPCSFSQLPAEGADCFRVSPTKDVLQVNMCFLWSKKQAQELCSLRSELLFHCCGCWSHAHHTISQTYFGAVAMARACNVLKLRSSAELFNVTHLTFSSWVSIQKLLVFFFFDFCWSFVSFCLLSVVLVWFVLFHLSLAGMLFTAKEEPQIKCFPFL